MSDSANTTSPSLTAPAPPALARIQWLWPWALCLTVILMVHHPFIFSGFTRAQANPSDTRLVNYFMEHTWQTLAGTPHHDSLWEMPFFYPQQNVGAYSDIVVALSPPYLFFRLVGSPPDLAFQLWLVIMTLLNFWVFYYFLRAGFSVAILPAAFGAAVFTAGAPRVNQLIHPQMYSHLLILLALIALMKLFAPPAEGGEKAGSRTWKLTTAWLTLFFAAGVAQCYAGFYNAFFLMLFLALAGVAALPMPPMRRRMAALLMQRWPTLLILALSSCALLAPMALHYRAAAAEQGMRSWAEVESMLPRPASWFYLGQGSWLYGKFSQESYFFELPMNHEHKLGVGLMTLAVMCYGLFQARKRASVKLLCVVLAGGVVGSTLWFHHVTAWALVYDFCPGAQAVRAVTRIGLVLLIPIAVGLAFALQQALQKRAWLAVFLGVVCLAEQGVTTPSFDRRAMQQQAAAIVARIDPSCKAFYVTLHANDDRCDLLNLTAMEAQISSGVPTVNGYSGWVPPGQERLYVSIYRNADEAAAIEVALQAWAARHGMRRKDICWIQLEPSRR